MPGAMRSAAATDSAARDERRARRRLAPCEATSDERGGATRGQTGNARVQARARANEGASVWASMTAWSRPRVANTCKRATISVATTQGEMDATEQAVVATAAVVRRARSDGGTHWDKMDPRRVWIVCSS